MNIFGFQISMMNLILWGCVIWMPAFFYVILHNETKFKKNISLGVTMPQEAQSDEAVLAILSSFKKQLAIACILITLVAFPCALISKIGTAMTVWMIWLLAGIVVPYIPYVLHHKKLKQLKADRGWVKTSGTVRVADLSGIAIKDKWLSPKVFLLPFAIALLPACFDKFAALIYIISAATVIFSWVAYRYLYRNKAEIVDNNMEVAEALTRVRRRSWGLVGVMMAWFMALMSLIFWLAPNNDSLILAMILFLSAVFTIAVLYIELRTRKLQETLTAQSGTDFYVDEDDYWIWGMFYYNPNDNRLFINNRTGVNTTVNLAKRSGQIFMLATAIMLASIPYFGVWMDQLESTPVGLEITSETVISTHTKVQYEVPIEDITYLEYVAEKPKLKRTMGTGMDSVLKGKFGTPWGSSNVCLDPRTTPFIYLETEDGKRYLFGSSNATETEAVYQQLITVVN